MSPPKTQKEAPKPLEISLKEYVEVITSCTQTLNDLWSDISDEPGGVKFSLDEMYDKLEGVEILASMMILVTKKAKDDVYDEKVKRLEEGGEDGPEKMNAEWLERMFQRMVSGEDHCGLV